MTASARIRFRNVLVLEYGSRQKIKKREKLAEGQYIGVLIRVEWGGGVRSEMEGLGRVRRGSGVRRGGKRRPSVRVK